MKSKKIPLEKGKVVRKRHYTLLQTENETNSAADGCTCDGDKKKNTTLIWIMRLKNKWKKKNEHG